MPSRRSSQRSICWSSAGSADLTSIPDDETLSVRIRAEKKLSIAAPPADA